MASIKNLQGLYCLRPFVNIGISSYNMTFCCNGSWLPGFNAGDIEKMTIWEAWNSEPMQKMRKSILDGTYGFCNKQGCPYLISDKSRIYTRDELQAVVNGTTDGMDLESELTNLKNLTPWISHILDGKVIMDILPASYSLSYDESCNFKCPSCRKESTVHKSGAEYERRLKIHKDLFDEIEKQGYENIRNLVVSGSGEPFVSSIFQDLLFNFDGREYPLLRFYIMTNGVLLTPDVWNKMSKIHSNIDNIFISMDAATERTYESIRVNGNFKNLLANIEFLGQKRKENKLKHLAAAVIVQKKNYKEMIDIISLCKKYNVDEVSLNSLDNWGSWSMEEYNENAVCNPVHPEHNEFLELLKNPIFDDPIVNLENISKYKNDR
ncbi:MAG TPA: radical SAM protein [Clostridia bacterium]